VQSKGASAPQNNIKLTFSAGGVEAPAWASDAIIAIVRFDMIRPQVGNPIQTGTAYLDYLSGLGVNTVHVKPIAQMAHGSGCSAGDIYYAVLDHQRIDPCLGTDPDFYHF
jgi:glycosidase